MIDPKKNLEKHIEELFSNISQDKNINPEEIQKAVNLGRQVHQGQFRKNGDFYFIHPIRVAIKASEYNLDSSTIISSLLHDAIEDTQGEENKNEVANKIKTTATNPI